MVVAGADPAAVGVGGWAAVAPGSDVVEVADRRVAVRLAASAAVAELEEFRKPAGEPADGRVPTDDRSAVAQSGGRGEQAPRGNRPCAAPRPGTRATESPSDEPAMASTSMIAVMLKTLRQPTDKTAHVFECREFCRADPVRAHRLATDARGPDWRGSDTPPAPHPFRGLAEEQEGVTPAGTGAPQVSARAGVGLTRSPAESSTSMVFGRPVRTEVTGGLRSLTGSAPPAGAFKLAEIRRPGRSSRRG